MKRLPYVLLALAVLAVAAVVAPGRDAGSPVIGALSQKAPVTSMDPDVWIPCESGTWVRAPELRPAGLMVRGESARTRPAADLVAPWTGGATASEDEDPWTPTPVQRVERVLVSVDGTLRFEKLEMEVPPRSATRPLTTYDLTALVPGTVHPLQPLEHPATATAADDSSQGGFLGVPPISCAARWWQDLARAILHRTLADSWHADAHLLAWDESRRHLLVRHDQRVLRLLEGVLDEFAGEASRIVPVRAEIMVAGAGPTALTLEVPSRRAVRTCRGIATSYVCDYDVEISFASVLSDPILQRLETGIGLAAMRLDSTGNGADEILLAIAGVAGPPALSLERVTFAGQPLDALGAVSLEIPATQQQAWHGRLPARLGVHVIELADGVSCRVSVGREQEAREPRSRAWQLVAPEAANAIPVLPQVSFYVRLDGARSGFVGAGTLCLTGAPAEGHLVLRRGRDTRGSGRLSPLVLANDHAMFGGVHLSAVTVGDPEAPTALDTELEVGCTTGTTRDVPVRYLVDDNKDARGSMRLPDVRLAVTSRRLDLTPEGTGTIEFVTDLGSGPERCTLELRRLPAR